MQHLSFGKRACQNNMLDIYGFIEELNRGLTTLSRIAVIEYQYNPRELVFQYDKVKLYHYRAKTEKQNKIPVLVVFATVNRPEILDLFPDQSFIGGLLENGMDVYLLDWGYPDVEDSDVTLDDYVANYLHLCVQFVKEQSQQEKINLIGICQGGLICLFYTILFSHIHKLTLISAPIDFKTRDNMISKFVQPLDVNDFVRQTGNISGAWLTQFFISLRPFELIGKKYLRYVDHLSDAKWTERFLQVEKWLHDAPDQTGASFAQLINDYYKQNKLIKGEAYINGRHVDLKSLKVPVLNVIASDDEIVPPSSSRALKKFVTKTLYSEQIYPSGHIGIYVSDKVGKAMPKEIALWLQK